VRDGFVERVHKSNGQQQPVALLSINFGSTSMHSYFTRFVDQEWKEKHGERRVTIASLFLWLFPVFPECCIWR
jgi:hypothetical protein